MPRTKTINGERLPLTPAEEAEADAREAAHNHPDAVAARAAAEVDSMAVAERALTLEKIWAVVKAKNLNITDADLPRRK